MLLRILRLQLMDISCAKFLQIDFSDRNRRFLFEKGIRYESSENGNLIHFEVFVNKDILRDSKRRVRNEQDTLLLYGNL